MAYKYAVWNGFEISNCCIRTRNIIGFTAQKWLNSDSLELRETAVFFYYPDLPLEKRWHFLSIGETTGVHGCATFKPKECCCFVTDEGKVYIADIAGQNNFHRENEIPRKNIAFFSNVKAIQKGHAIAVGPYRNVSIRQDANKWIKLDKGLFPDGYDIDLEHPGFADIDGFSENDMYACGGTGDLWHYNGNLWTQIDIPTNSVLKKICCAGESVYIITSSRDVLIGRGHRWKLVKQKLTKKTLENIVYYDGRVIISTVSKLFFMDGDVFSELDLGIPKMNSMAHLAAGDGILIVAGVQEATMFDGNKWSVILEAV